MGFPRLPTYARNEPFGPAAHNDLLRRQDFLYDSLAVEHDPSSGEHNTPHVARTLGHVAWSGAAYSLTGFNSDASLATGHNPAAGNVIITLPDGRYDATSGIITLQPADATGNVTPWIAHAAFVDARHVSVVLRKNTAGLGVQQDFDMTDGGFFIGIHSPQLPNSLSMATAAGRRRVGEGLRVGSADWNPFIQSMGDNRVAALVGHTSAGLHNTREVAKACGFVEWDGAAYVVRAHRGLEAGVTRIAEGRVRVHVPGMALSGSASVQAFVSPVSDAPGTTEAGEIGVAVSQVSPEGARVAMVPHDTCGSTVEVYLFENYINSNGAFNPPEITYLWRAVDCSFSIRVHGQ